MSNAPREKAMSSAPRALRPDTFWQRNRKSNGYLLRSRVGRGFVSFVRALLLFGLCFMIIQPILTKISVSIMTESDLYDSTVIVLPRNLTTDNYTLTAMLMTYSKALFNTLWITFIIALVQVAACTLVGYGFARFNFPLKKFWFACVLLVIIVPPQTISTSLYLSFQFFDVLGIFKAITGSAINLRKSLVPYVLMSATCMGLKNGLYIFMVRQYFKGIPQSLEEAAYVDGCGNFATFIKVLLPDAIPILVSCFLFSFVWQWTDRFYTRNFLTGYTMLSSELATLADRLAFHVGNKLQSTNAVSVARTQQIVSTGVLMGVAPVILLYIFAQRGFVESLSSTGLKD